MCTCAIRSWRIILLINLFNQRSGRASVIPVRVRIRCLIMRLRQGRLICLRFVCCNDAAHVLLLKAIVYAARLTAHIGWRTLQVRMPRHLRGCDEDARLLSASRATVALVEQDGLILVVRFPLGALAFAFTFGIIE